jgi:Bacteriophage lambda head decoration protein D
MATYTEGQLPLEFLLSCANGQRSFEQVTLTASQGALAAGMVMARVTATGNYVPYDDDANAGTPGAGVALGVLCYPVENSASTQLITIVARDAEVKTAALRWEASNDGTEQTAGLADLAAVGIIARA